MLPISAFTTTLAICHKRFACSHLTSPRELFLSEIQLCIYFLLLLLRRVFLGWGSVSKFLSFFGSTPCLLLIIGKVRLKMHPLSWSWGQVASLPWGDAGWRWHVGLFAHRSISRSCQCPVKLLGLLSCAA